MPIEVADVARVGGVARLERRADDARLVHALAQRVDLEVLLIVRERGVAAAGDRLEAAHHHPVPVGARPKDEVTLGHVAVVSRRQEEVLAALAAVEAGIAEVRHVTHEAVVDDAQDLRRHLDDGGARLLQVDAGARVHALGVVGQADVLRPAFTRLGVHDHATGLADAVVARVHVQHGLHRHRGNEVEIGLRGALHIELVVQLLDCLRRRITAFVPEFVQIADHDFSHPLIASRDRASLVLQPPVRRNWRRSRRARHE
jgi:hypothetical protein